MKTQMYADMRRYKSKPKARFSSASICVHLCLTLCVFSGFAQAQETITVAVASSLYGEMQKQAKAFEKDHDVMIRLIPGSTGRLYNQIMHGAPFDVFIAADSERPAMLSKQGKALDNKVVGLGYLGVMLAHQVIADPDRLMDASVRHIAIANPDVAPFGQLSKALLIKLALWEALKPKLVYAQNAMQAKMMVDQGLVDAGFVPVLSRQDAIAVIHYHGVLLHDSWQALSFLTSLEGGFAANRLGATEVALPHATDSGGAAQGECCLQQREHPGVLAALNVSAQGLATLP